MCRLVTNYHNNIFIKSIDNINETYILSIEYKETFESVYLIPKQSIPKNSRMIES